MIAVIVILLIGIFVFFRLAKFSFSDFKNKDSITPHFFFLFSIFHIVAYSALILLIIIKIYHPC